MLEEMLAVDQVAGVICKGQAVPHVHPQIRLGGQVHVDPAGFGIAPATDVQPEAGTRRAEWGHVEALDPAQIVSE